MKNYVFVFFILIATTAFSQDFRNASWGMTKENISKSETASTIKTEYDDVLNYSVNIGGFDLTLQYLFSNNQLYGASYFRGFENNNYVESYNNQKLFFTKMLDLLNLKYGKGELVDKNRDIFVFYDSNQKKIKKYVNDDIDSFLNANETMNNIQYKHLEKNIFVIGYVYCVKYITDSTVILLLVQQKGADIQQEVMYMNKKSYAILNSNIRDSLVNDSGL